MPSKTKARGRNERILVWASGPSNIHNYAGLEDKIPKELMDCFNKCDAKYPVLNAYTQFLHLMCIEECRREFLTRTQQASNNK